jgi:hypothetical protein
VFCDDGKYQILSFNSIPSNIDIQTGELGKYIIRTRKDTQVSFSGLKGEGGAGGTRKWNDSVLPSFNASSLKTVGILARHFQERE